MRKIYILVMLLTTFCLNSHAESNDNRDVSYFYPGERIAEDEMRVTIMGSAGEIGPSQATCSIFVETGNGDSFIFDLGAGSSANYNAMGVPFSKMNKIFLSHLHVDHISDLVYIYGWGPAYGQVKPMHIWGPSSSSPEYGIVKAMEGLKQLTSWHRRTYDILPHGDGFKLEVHPVDYHKNPSIVYNENGVVIRSFPAVHVMDGPVSYRLDWNGLSFVFSGDSSPSKFLLDNAQDVDFLIHEVAGPADLWSEKSGMPLEHAEIIVNGVHTTSRALGKLLSLTKPKMAALIQAYVSPDMNMANIDAVRSNYDGAIRIAEDLMVFNITKEKVTQRMAIAPSRPWWKVERTPGNLPAPKATADELLSKWLRDAIITDF